MNQFLKKTLIFAMIILSIGIAICLVCTAIGGTAFLSNMKTIVTEETNISEQLSNIEFDGNVNLNNLNIHSGNVNCDFNSKYPTYTGKHTDDHAADASEIEDLNITIGGGTCTISESNDDEFHIIADSEGEYQYYTKGNTFYVHGFQQKNLNNISHALNDHHIEIQIPEDFEFENVTLEVGAGEMTLDKIICEKDISLEVGAGDITIHYLVSKDADFEVGAGNLYINDGSLKEASFEVGLGNLTYTGNVTNDLKASCGMGNIELFLKENQKDHNYHVSCAMGNITLGSNNYSGAALEQKLDYDAKYTYTLDCTMGNIDVIYR